MSLAEEYRRQFVWRDWKTALDLCPIRTGQKVLDLGCGPGDISRELAARGALVTGIDGNPDLLKEARKNCSDSCEFIEKQLTDLHLESDQFDGLWCSFTAAYFTNFDQIFRHWIPALKKNAWVCLIDMDDLFGHDPVSDEMHKRIEDFYGFSFTRNQYDFLAGRKLEKILSDSGFSTKSVLLQDQELTFNGTAKPEILRAWQDRLDRMNGPKRFFGTDFLKFKNSLMGALSSEQHESSCRVFCCIGQRTY